MDNDLEYKEIIPEDHLSIFVDSIWKLHNKSNSHKELILVPDGRIDLLFSWSPNHPFRIGLFGFATYLTTTTIYPDSLIYAVSFKPLGAEYILQENIAELQNEVLSLKNNYLGISKSDKQSFKYFVQKISAQLKKSLCSPIDDRKRNLFDLIHSNQGNISIKHLSEKIFWKDRQINRYFNRYFGLSLKSYCNIIRFYNSVQQMHKGKFIPQEYFADQSHAIREIRKFTGLRPKEVIKNQNDRFVQFLK